MGKNFPAFKLLDGEVGGYAALQRELQRWRHRLPAWVRAPVWLVILSILIILGLLLVFHQVVLEAVQQSELRRKANAMHIEATWRCNSLRGPRASYSCLLRLNSAGHGDTLLQAQNTKLARE